MLSDNFLFGESYEKGRRIVSHSYHYTQERKLDSFYKDKLCNVYVAIFVNEANMFFEKRNYRNFPILQSIPHSLVIEAWKTYPLMILSRVLERTVYDP
jgi:hypothetical protein